MGPVGLLLSGNREGPVREAFDRLDAAEAGAAHADGDGWHGYEGPIDAWVANGGGTVLREVDPETALPAPQAVARLRGAARGLRDPSAQGTEPSSQQRGACRPCRGASEGRRSRRMAGPAPDAGGGRCRQSASWPLGMDPGRLPAPAGRLGPLGRAGDRPRPHGAARPVLRGRLRGFGASRPPRHDGPHLNGWRERPQRHRGGGRTAGGTLPTARGGGSRVGIAGRSPAWGGGASSEGWRPSQGAANVEQTPRRSARGLPASRSRRGVAAHDARVPSERADRGPRCLTARYFGLRQPGGPRRPSLWPRRPRKVPAPPS